MLSPAGVLHATAGFLQGLDILQGQFPGGPDICKGYFLEAQIFCKGYFLEAKILCKGNFLKARPYHVQGHAQFGSVVSGGVIGRRPCGMLCENMEVSSFVPHILRLLLATKGIS